MKNKEQNSNGSGGGWFKSLDRLTKRGKNKAKVSYISRPQRECGCIGWKGVIVGFKEGCGILVARGSLSGLLTKKNFFFLF